VRIFPEVFIESISFLALIYCQTDEASEHAQHKARILGNALGEVTEMYTKMNKHKVVITIPAIDIPIVAESPNAFRVSSGVPV
jgi:hypothetical protein